MHLTKLHLNNGLGYRKFPDGFQIEFNGDLVILSGINGSGKTQLLEILKGRERRNPTSKISRDVFVDGEIIRSRQSIVYKTFYEYVNISAFSEGNSRTSLEIRSNIWQAYRDNRLDAAESENSDLANSYQKVINLLIEKYGEDRYRAKTITEQEVYNAIPDDFVLVNDDIFTNKIGEIFFSYVSLEHNLRAELATKALATGDKRIDESELEKLPEPPWKTLNDLFQRMGVRYRFRDYYFRKNDLINEKPSIFGIDAEGRIIEDKKREIADLSDGEKAIISLMFAVINVDFLPPKLVLLDEYDATLNPSLINPFFDTLKRAFLDRGIPVILCTHSPATLSLAPEYAQFYEVLNLPSGEIKIETVDRDDYEDMRVANDRFYSKLKDSEERLAELKQQQEEILNELKEQIRTLRKDVLFLEGKTDKEYLEKAATFFPELNSVLATLDIRPGKGCGNLKNIWDAKDSLLGIATKRVVLLYDSDQHITEENLSQKIYKLALDFNDNNSVKKGIENLFPDSLFDRAKEGLGIEILNQTIVDPVSGKTIYVLEESVKSRLCTWICENGSMADFAAFSAISQKLQFLTPAK